MNIIKLQDMLRSVPDNALINYVQNPSGQVPSYLALSELQRRKDTRDKYQQQQTPQSSVAEDLEQETAQGGLAMLAKNPTPQGAPMSQGVADLPVDDSMYQDQNFAAGGIVAFDNGGRVYPNYEGPATSAIGRAWDSITGGLKGYGDKKSKLMDIQQQIESLTPNIFEQLTPSQLSTRKAQIADLKAQQDAIRNPSSGYEYKPGEKATISPEEVKQRAIDEAIKTDQKDKGARSKGLDFVDKEKAPAADQKIKPVNVLPGEETQPTSTTAESQIERIKKLLGDNPNSKALQEKLDKMEARAQRQEDLAPWMALTEAGFKTMQGTSPFALANIGAGAEAGIKSYGAAQDKLAALEEKRYALMNEAAKADRAEQVAIVTKGFESEDAALARQQKDRIANMNAQLEREKIAATKQIAKDKLTSDAALIRMANFGMKDQAAIDKYVKDKMGANATILNQLKGMDASKMTPERKAFFDKLIQQEQALIKEAEGKYSINALTGRAGLTGTQTKKTSVDESDPLGIL